MPRLAALPVLWFSYLHTQPRFPYPTTSWIRSAPETPCRQLRPDNWREAYHAAATTLLGEPGLNSWVGSCAHWLQGAYPSGTFGLQFDSTDDFLWDDSSLLYACANFDDPTQISFQL